MNKSRTHMPWFIKVVSHVSEIMLSEWKRDVENLLGEVERWCGEYGWSNKRIPKVVSERLLGPYGVEKLQFHTGQAGYMLDPIAILSQVLREW